MTPQHAPVDAHPPAEAAVAAPATKAVPARSAKPAKPAKAAKPAAPRKAVAAKPKPVTQPATQPATKPVPSKVGKKSVKPRPALVRDSFTMPDADFSLIATLKSTALDARRAAKKSELLRAGLRLLADLDAPSLVAALDRLDAVKTGRPKKGH